MRPMYLFVITFLVLLTAAAMQQGMAQTTPTVAVSPVVLVPFDTSGFGDTQAGISLSLHVVPQEWNLWASQHVTLEIPCVGTTFDSLKAGLGAAVNLSSSEKINVKAGLVYVQSLKKPAVMLGLSFPL